MGIKLYRDKNFESFLFLIDVNFFNKIVINIIKRNFCDILLK